MLTIVFKTVVLNNTEKGVKNLNINSLHFVVSIYSYNNILYLLYIC